MRRSDHEGSRVVSASGFFARFEAVTAVEVVVNQAHGLHESVASGGTDKAPASFLEILAESDRFGRGGQCLGFGPGQGCLTSRRLELTKVKRKIGKLLQQFERPPGVVDGRAYLALMPHDSSIGEEVLDILFSKTPDLVEIEPGESGAKVPAFAQDGQPRKTGLKSFEADLFEKAEVVRDLPPPFPVMVTKVFLIVATPPASFATIGTSHESIG